MDNLISITIPSYNGEKYIAECIKSIQSQKVNTEIIVIDDISSDKTVEIAKSLGAKVFVNKHHKGQVAGKNEGIKHSKGDYWLTIDQDDMLREGALLRLLDEINKDKSIKIVMAKLQDFCSSNFEENQRFCKPQPFRGILTGSTLFRISVFKEIGLFREDLITGDVIDLTTRLSSKSIQIKYIDFISCDRRIHESNYGRTNQKNEYKDYAKLLRSRINSKLNK